MNDKLSDYLHTHPIPRRLQIANSTTLQFGYDEITPPVNFTTRNAPAANSRIKFDPSLN